MKPSTCFADMSRYFSLDVEVDAGTLLLSVAYHGFPIYSEKKDLCEKTVCPVKKGPVEVALEEPFPIITPPVSLLSDPTCPT